MPSWPDYLISAVFLTLFLFQILSAARTFGTYKTRIRVRIQRKDERRIPFGQSDILQYARNGYGLTVVI
jgi:hypothetical protein